VGGFKAGVRPAQAFAEPADPQGRMPATRLSAFAINPRVSSTGGGTGKWTGKWRIARSHRDKNHPAQSSAELPPLSNQRAASSTKSRRCWPREAAEHARQSAQLLEVRRQ